MDMETVVEKLSFLVHTYKGLPSLEIGLSVSPHGFHGVRLRASWKEITFENGVKRETHRNAYSKRLSCDHEIRDSELLEFQWKLDQARKDYPIADIRAESSKKRPRRGK